MTTTRPENKESDESKPKELATTHYAQGLEKSKATDMPTLCQSVNHLIQAYQLYQDFNQRAYVIIKLKDIAKRLVLHSALTNHRVVDSLQAICLTALDRRDESIEEAAYQKELFQTARDRLLYFRNLCKKTESLENDHIVVLYALNTVQLAREKYFKDHRELSKAKNAGALALKWKTRADKLSEFYQPVVMYLPDWYKPIVEEKSPANTK